MKEDCYCSGATPAEGHLENGNPRWFDGGWNRGSLARRTRVRRAAKKAGAQSAGLCPLARCCSQLGAPSRRANSHPCAKEFPSLIAAQPKIADSIVGAGSPVFGPRVSLSAIMKGCANWRQLSSWKELVTDGSPAGHGEVDTGSGAAVVRCA
jgi:hypothetical protein